ncbi:hypothetical protein ROHU_002400 [Labeo rohita]|uniref:Uncharacterized protein n=1 Tax=Labeo rohita TaxID=84645 RepID=A0A498NXR3_LABRO|nr:hypothetical protein ROHU_002400 [Labeo rohita]
MEPESPKAHVSAVGAVDPPESRLCVGATQAKDARLVVIGEFDWLRTGGAIARCHPNEVHWNTAGEKACPLRRVDHTATSPSSGRRPHRSATFLNQAPAVGVGGDSSPGDSLSLRTGPGTEKPEFSRQPQPTAG